MDQTLERLRKTQALFEVERRKVVDGLQQVEKLRSFADKATTRANMWERIKRMEKLNREIQEDMNDSSGLLKKELDAIKGGNSDSKIFSEFYGRLRDVREFHRANPVSKASELERYNYPVNPPFNPAEANGRLLDLSHFFQQYIDMKAFHKTYNKYPLKPEIKTRISYEQYLSIFANFQYVRRSHKFNRNNLDEETEYIKYLKDLKKYLWSFFQRKCPIIPFQKVVDLIEGEFNKRWEAGHMKGWQEKYPPGVVEDPTVSYTAKRKRKELIVQGRWCVVCDKQIISDKKKISKGEIDRIFEKHNVGKKHKRALKLYNFELCTKKNLPVQFRAVALLEHWIAALNQVLSESVLDTINDIEKKQTKTYAEIVREREETELKDEEESSSSDGEDVPYNPKGVPLGWDGKPIPYWLYKLHGLNIEYVCDICRYSYWGPRAFKRHFSDARHTQRLKQLGIANTKHFHNITKVEDAVKLARKLTLEQQNKVWRPEVEEEFEDEMGYVYLKSMYDQLVQQGAI